MPKFNVHIRVGPEGQTISLTQSEIEAGMTLDDNYSGDEPYYDTIIEIDAPEPRERQPVASVIIDEPPLTPVEVRKIPA